MAELRRLTPDDWRLWRDVRLQALAQAPYAFGSTLAREQAFTEATWRERLGAPGAMTVLALVGDEPVGTMGAFTPPETQVPMLVGAWTHPAHRGRGVADALVTDVLAWARECGHRRIDLHVADGNEPARRLFVRHGFVPTGDREPLESNPDTSAERFTIRLAPS